MRGRAGARAISSLFQYIPPPLIKFFRTKPKQAGKKEGGLGEGIFARLLCPPKAGWRWESVSAIPASAERQNRKIFVSLIEKSFRGRRLKNVKKIFLFCSAVRRKETLGGISARQDRNCCSKKVRTSSSNCDQ